ncbi:MAG: MFS transporter [Alphaproteobacteria bacterium]|nr:MFS transporter [Alphaproteobacteria bacterium]
MTTAGARAPDFSFRSNGYAWYVLAVLCLGSVVSTLDRQVINLLVEPIKADLGVSDTQISLLQGFAFALFYAVMAVPLGRLADTASRRNVIFYGVLLFSLATMSCGLATSFLALFVARMAVGVGEATLSPAGFSMLSDYFPKDQLGRAVGLFVGTTYVGSGVALIAIGWMLDLLGQHDPLMVPGFGPLADWQAAFVLAAIPGLGFAALMLTVREPPRQGQGATERPEPPALAELGVFLRSNRALTLSAFIGLPLLAASQFGINAWAPTFFIRSYGWTAAEIGPLIGLGLMTLSPLGVLAGGWFADRSTRSGKSDGYLRVPVLAALASAPFVVLFPLAPSGEVALALLAPVMFLGAMPFAAGSAAIPAVAPNRMRAQLTAIYLLIANLVGAGAGPWAIAAFTDGVMGDPAKLYLSLSVVGLALLLAGVTFVAAGWRLMRREA